MKRTGYILLFLLSYFIPTKGTGKDSIHHQQAIGERISPLSHIGISLYLNPALQPYAWEYEFSSLRIAGKYLQEKEAVIVQQGEGYRQGLFRAESYMRLKPHITLWGYAGYQFGKVKSVHWNETSDFEVLYPYVMADSVGGDMNTESYTFCGGYAQTKENFSWGFSGDYRATIEYRKMDPRPRNVVSDLQLRGGISFRLNNRYRIGTGLYSRIYRQRNSIKFYSDLGAAKIYQMLGMGMYSIRFSGSSSGVQFDGGTIGGHFSLLPKNRQGLFIDFGTNHFNVKRTLLDHNYLPLTRIDEKDFYGTIAWRKMTTYQEWGLELTATHQDRKGSEYVYGESTGSHNFPKINELEMYQNQRTTLQLQGILGQDKTERHKFWLKAHTGIHRIHSHYLSPSLDFKTFQYQGGFTFSLRKNSQKSMYCISVHGQYVGQLSEKWDLSLLNTENSIRKTLNRQFQQLTTPAMHYGFSALWTHPIYATLTLSIDLQWKHIHFEHHNASDYIEIGCSLHF